MENTENASTRGQQALKLARQINARLTANGGPTQYELGECRKFQQQLIELLREDLEAAEGTVLGDEAVLNYLIGKED